MSFHHLSYSLRTTVLLVGLALSAAAGVAADNPRTNVPLDTALADARLLATRKPGLTVVRVAGDSMLPYFGDGAVLVVKRAAAAQLQPGMIVLYTNALNETVAHRIVTADAAGCTVQGYNNDRADSTRVTAENLQGVVYATFHSAADRPVLDLSGVQLALAAPAR